MKLTTAIRNTIVNDIIAAGTIGDTALAVVIYNDTGTYKIFSL